MYYDGSGTLLRREFSTGEYWDYVAELTFKNGVPHQFTTPAGRLIYNNDKWEFEYFIQDHLGNVRVALKDSLGRLVKTSETAYDPTGIELEGVGLNDLFENRFKHQGKESMALFGLGNIEEFGARYLDKSIMRWQSVDPLASKMPSWSPYNYAFNNPVRFVDPDGRAPDDFVKRADGSIYWDNNANDQASTKAGETYLGKSLSFNFNSYIDANL